MKSITFHTKLMSMLAIHAVLVLYAMFTEWNWWYLLAAFLTSKMFNALGNEIALHRLWCHKAFTTSRWKEFILHFFATPLLYGSSVTYAGIHRQHHAYSDTPKDPHITRPWWKVVFYVRNKEYEIENRFVSDVIRDPWHRWTHRHYFKLNLALLVAMLVMFGPFYTGWSLSFIVVYNFIAAGLVNVIGHRPEYGTRTFDTDDQSSNNKFLQWLTWNEGLHNHHHHNAGAYRFTVNKGDFDFPAFLIEKLFMKS